ncbi:MAG: hypothetical protein COU68_04360 [Candidatus Pacebacteria bacterium CG10_big_fil_rev_8_21_14_0_10_45_6]|nr:MAG: hypothetical protein COU68_04360 [Candidatus Pacebacteria bacterium CG10_big_fil_rev_8_21_14_0_10_45_6]
MKHLPAAGFTLIELMVVTAIMAIIIGGSIAGYVQFNEYQSLVTTGRSMENMIKLAKNRARIRAVSVCNNGDAVASNDFQGYRTIVNANGSANMYALCGSTADSADVVGSAVETLAAPAGFTPTGGVGGTFNFYTPQSRKEPVISVSAVGITTSRNSYVIFISPTGVISSAITPYDPDNPQF